MTTRQTPVAVREAISADIAKQLDEPWRDRVILRPEQWKVVLAALDSRAGDAGEGVREGQRVRLESGETGVVNRIDYVVQLDEADGTQGAMGGSVGIITVQVDELSATPAPAVDAQEVTLLPETIGRVRLGDRRSDGERLCSHGHAVPAGHPLYWPEQISQYDDSDPLCLTHAIDQLESDNADWGVDCEAVDAVPAGEVERLGDALFALSADLRDSGFFADAARHANYERVVAAYQSLSHGEGRK